MAAPQKDFDVLYKILIIGDSAVGKSSLLMRFTDDSFTPNFISTIGIDFKAKIINVDGERIKMQIWDTAGQERFRTITTAYFRSAVGILLVYDVTNAETFQNLNQWMKSIEMHATDEVTKLLVANKADMTDKRVVDKTRGEELARQYGVKFFETSAKTALNVATLFETLAREIKKKSEGHASPSQEKEKEGTISGDKLAANSTNGKQSNEKSGCCK